MYQLTAVYGDVGFWYLAQSRMLLGVGLPLIFLSITAASYDGIRPDRIDQASALINVARNTGGSLGVALVSNVLAHREQFHQSRLVEHADPSSSAYPGDSAATRRSSSPARAARRCRHTARRSVGSGNSCRCRRHSWPTWMPSGS